MTVSPGAPAGVEHPPAGAGLTYLFSSFSGLPATYFQGYAFAGRDFVVHHGGARAYRDATGHRVPPGEDGCYVTVRPGPQGPEIGVDHAGFMKMFCYSVDDVWCVSNSLVRMAEHLRSHGVVLRPNHAQLAGLRLSTSFAEQLSSPTTVFAEIRLVPRGRRLVLTPEGLRELAVPADRIETDYPSALRSYLTTWRSRLAAMMSDAGVGLTADLSGGLDSRVVFAQVVAAAGSVPLDDAVRLISGRSAAQQADLRVARRLATPYEATLNRPDPAPAAPDYSAAESFAAWRDLCLGVYLPIYVPRVRLAPGQVNLSGLGGESYRPFYPQLPPDEFVTGLAGSAPTDELRAWCREVSDLLQRWEADVPGVHPLVTHYREFRARFHGGLFAQTKINVTPLASRLIEPMAARSGAGRQFYFDIMESLVPGLMDEPFDVVAKAPTDQNRHDLTVCALPADVAPGRVYAAGADATLLPTDHGPTFMSRLAEELSAATGPRVRELLGSRILDDATAVMQAAVERGSLGHARRASNVSRVLTAHFALSMTERSARAADAVGRPPSPQETTGTGGDPLRFSEATDRGAAEASLSEARTGHATNTVESEEAPTAAAVTVQPDPGDSRLQDELAPVEPTGPPSATADLRPPLAQVGGSSSDDPPVRRASHALRRAEGLWEAGKQSAATEVLRRHLLLAPDDGDAWTAYGSMMLWSGEPGVAAEAVKNVLDRDPTSVEGLELLVAAIQQGPSSLRQYRKKALVRAADGVAARPDRHLDLAAFFIAERHQRGLTQLDASPDPLASAAVRLAANGEDSWPALLSGLSCRDAQRVRLHVRLARGGIVQAAVLLAELEPDAMPVPQMRMALHRLIGSGRAHRAQPLLQQYLRARPADTWARSHRTAPPRRAPTGRGPNGVDDTERRLMVEGFPLPEASVEPRHVPTPGRVLYLAHNSLPFHSAGYATRSHGLLTALNADGWDADVVTRLGYPFDLKPFHQHPAIEPTEELDGVLYRRLTHEPVIERRRPIDSYVERYARALEQVVQTERPTLLHAASNHVNGLAAVLTARRLGLPSVYEVRGLWEVTRLSREPEWEGSEGHRFAVRMESDAARAATRVIAITDALREEMVSRGVEPGKITVVPNGVDTDRFVPRQRDEELAARLGVSGKTVIGYVGSVLDYEGLGLLVEAAGVLAGEREDFVVLVVGDGRYLPTLENQVEDRGLGAVVRFLGRVPHEEVESYYSIMDVCPLPRLPLPVCEMVSPLKPFEAMAMGKVVVASDVAALAEIVGDGVTGLLHEKGSAASLASRLRLLLDDEQLRVRLSVQAREWVVAHRRWDVLARRVADVWTGLAPAQPTVPA